MQRKFRPGVCPQEVFFLTGDAGKSTVITKVVPAVLKELLTLQRRQPVACTLPGGGGVREGFPRRGSDRVLE